MLSTSAAARRKGIDAAAATASRSMYEAHKRDVMPPPGWDPTLVDRVVSTTAADVMRRPCVVKPKPDQMVHYVDDNATVQACAKILNEKRIGVLMVNSAIDGSVVGIMSERDFVKALADGSTDQAIVADLMTPIAKMVTVSVTTSVGECMEKMRAHGIRHLPVMASQAGEGKDAAVENLRSVAEKSAEAARKQFSAFEAKLRDAFGDADGQRTYDGLLADPDAFASDERPLLRRVDGGGEAQARRGAARRRRGLYVGAAGVAPGGDHLDPRPAAHDDGEPGGAPPRLAQRGAPHADRGARRLLGVNSTHEGGRGARGGGRHHSSKFVISISCEYHANTGP